MTNPFLIGEKIYLRASDPGDAKVFAISENHPDLRETLYYAFPTTIDQQAEKIRKTIVDPNVIIFTICTIADDNAIGTTQFVRIDWVGRMAIFYLAIAEKENWSKGYGSETTRIMVDYAFETLNLNRIQLHVSAENTAAKKVYEKIGFQTEGTLRQAMFFNGQYVDFYVMGILKEDWLLVQNPEKKNK